MAHEEKDSAGDAAAAGDGAEAVAVEKQADPAAEAAAVALQEAQKRARFTDNLPEDYEPKAGPDDHLLQHSYSFWFNRRVQGARTQENYEKNIKRVATFSSVELFWAYYNHMVRPNDLPNTSDYHLFKKGIKPMWEDDANRKGGKWIVRLRKGLASKYWEELVLALIGGQFPLSDELCGIVISIRFQEDIISVWNRTSTDRDAKRKIQYVASQPERLSLNYSVSVFHKRTFLLALFFHMAKPVLTLHSDTLKRALSLPSNVVMEYKAHDASIKDNSSFRNTDVFRGAERR